MPVKNKIYNVEFGGFQTLNVAKTLTQAEKDALKEIGTMNEPISVRLATKEDIAWVKGMGGRIPTI